MSSVHISYALIQQGGRFLSSSTSIVQCVLILTNYDRETKHLVESILLLLLTFLPTSLYLLAVFGKSAWKCFLCNLHQVRTGQHNAWMRRNNLLM